jgi:hypothetical protein
VLAMRPEERCFSGRHAVVAVVAVAALVLCVCGLCVYAALNECTGRPGRRPCRQLRDRGSAKVGAPSLVVIRNPMAVSGAPAARVASSSLDCKGACDDKPSGSHAGAIMGAPTMASTGERCTADARRTAQGRDDTRDLRAGDAVVTMLNPMHARAGGVAVGGGASAPLARLGHALPPSVIGGACQCRGAWLDAVDTAAGCDSPTCKRRLQLDATSSHVATSHHSHVQLWVSPLHSVAVGVIAIASVALSAPSPTVQRIRVVVLVGVACAAAAAALAQRRRHGSQAAAFLTVLCAAAAAVLASANFVAFLSSRGDVGGLANETASWAVAGVCCVLAAAAVAVVRGEQRQWRTHAAARRLPLHGGSGHGTRTRRGSVARGNPAAVGATSVNAPSPIAALVYTSASAVDTLRVARVSRGGGAVATSSRSLKDRHGNSSASGAEPSDSARGAGMVAAVPRRTRVSLRRSTVSGGGSFSDRTGPAKASTTVATEQAGSVPGLVSSSRTPTPTSLLELGEQHEGSATPSLIDGAGVTGAAGVAHSDSALEALAARAAAPPLLRTNGGAAHAPGPVSSPPPAPRLDTPSSAAPAEAQPVELARFSGFVVDAVTQSRTPPPRSVPPAPPRPEAVPLPHHRAFRRTLAATRERAMRILRDDERIDRRMGVQLTTSRVHVQRGSSTSDLHN